jgi:hypothetical protein
MCYFRSLSRWMSRLPYFKMQCRVILNKFTNVSNESALSTFRLEEWKKKQLIPPKRWWRPSTLHGVISHTWTSKNGKMPAYLTEYCRKAFSENWHTFVGSICISCRQLLLLVLSEMFILWVLLFRQKSAKTRKRNQQYTVKRILRTHYWQTDIP